MKENIDELFKKGLGEPDIPYEEMHWLAMQKKLDQKNNHREFAWWTFMSTAAALLLIAFVWWNLKSNDTNENSKLTKAKKPGVESINGKASPIKTPDNKSPMLVKVTKEKSGMSSNRIHKKTETIALTNKTYVQKDIAFNITEQSITPQLNVFKDSNTSINPAIPNFETPQIVQSVKSKPVKDEKKTSAKPKFKPGFTLSITAAPDLNAVNTFKHNSLGANAGILATVSVSSGLSFTTGAVYAKKVYRTEFSSYKPNTNYTFPVNPSEVYADCYVLDIPLNANLRVWENKKVKVNISAGASSYIMLKERYEFKYDDPYYQPVSRTYKNENRHYFGVANLSVSYDRKLSNRVGIGVQPYVKLPFADIGHGNVKLISAGVAVNFNLNLKKYHD